MSLRINKDPTVLEVIQKHTHLISCAHIHKACPHTPTYTLRNTWRVGKQSYAEMSSVNKNNNDLVRAGNHSEM